SRISGLSFSKYLRTTGFCPVVNSVMCVVRGCYKEFWIENPVFFMYDVLRRHGVHMMNDWSIVNIEPVCAQVASLISDDNKASYISPLTRSIETLIQVPIEPKSRPSNSAAKSEVLKPLFKRA